jgi:hypothetical protein
MRGAGLSCFCAHCCFPCNTRTWANALRYADVDPGRAELASYAAGAAGQAGGSGEESWVASFARLFASAAAAQTGESARKKLERHLGLEAAGDASWFARFCCMPCVQFQEADTVLLFYRESLGYSDATYGSLARCNCTRFESARGDAGAGRRAAEPQTIPYPRDARGPAGPAKGGPIFTEGFTLVGGVPTARGSGPRPDEIER